MDRSDVKQLLEDNFAYLTKMSVREYTLYRKWIDIQKKYNSLIPKESTFDDFFENEDDNSCHEIETIKNNIWVPRNPDDYKDLQPRLVFATNNEYTRTWQILRDFCHSAIWHQSPGRLFKYYVIDDVTQKFIGMLSMGSDFISIGGRDDYIGWSRDIRLQGKLKNTLMCSTIAAVQPLGFNYNGGKLIALLAASSDIADKWEERYNDKLVGCSTTSLYGGGSMYNRLKYWRKCKSSAGEMAIEPSEDVWDIARVWLRNNHPELIPVTPPGKQILSHPKFKYLSEIYKVCGIKVPKNNAPRGVYWNDLYTDTREFLRGEIPEVTQKRYDNSTESLTELWKTTYASKRVKNILKSDRWSNDVLFYDDMLTLTWEGVKEKYLE